jgi:hypothetical protein
LHSNFCAFWFCKWSLPAHPIKCVLGMFNSCFQKSTFWQQHDSSYKSELHTKSTFWQISDTFAGPVCIYIYYTIQLFPCFTSCLSSANGQESLMGSVRPSSALRPRCDRGQSLLGHVKWPQPAPLWHVVPWPMPIYEQVQNVRYHLLRPCAGRCQACRARLHLLCLLFCCSTLPAREEPRPDSKGRLPSVWCRAWWSEMTAWSAGPTRFNGCRFWWVVRFRDPTNEQSSQSVSQQPFLGILGGKNQQKWSKIYVGQSKSLSAGGETSKHSI